MGTMEAAGPRRVVSPPRDKAAVTASFDPEAFGIPTGREEQWRYTPVRRLRALFEPLAQVDGADVEVIAADSRVVVSRVASSEAGWLVPLDRASALAWRLAPTTLAVRIPAGVTVAEPVTISITGRISSYQHLRIIAEPDAVATVVIEHRGDGEHVENVEIALGPGARLNVVSLQDWNRGATQLLRLHAQVGRAAELTQLVATFGGSLVRVVSSAGFGGVDGSARLLGAHFTEAKQHHEHRLFVDHSRPHCRSDVLYKGALQGEQARSVWVGDVLIRGRAIDTDTYETNRNLILSPGARADSVPNLEIETGEVIRAGHASATGRFDDEQLFYLMSRGIDSARARELVVRGFLAEVLLQASDPVVRDRLLEVLERRLAAAAADPSSGVAVGSKERE